MLEWIKRVAGMARDQPVADQEAETPRRQASTMSGKYLALHKYLLNRYADTVVLTFADIEDLLGFALPTLARDQQDWWTSTGPATVPSGHTDAWRLANRTARPNLLAQTVVFERVS